MLIPKIVNNIARHLNRKDLKQYIRGLKIQERKLSVFIDVPTRSSDIKYKFGKIFPDKKIVYGVDNSLMLGLRIIDDDMLFEINLKNTLDKILSYLEQNYD